MAERGDADCSIVCLSICDCWQLIRRCLHMLKPDNFNLILMSQKFAQESCCNLQEYWYKTRYGVVGKYILQLLWSAAKKLNRKLAGPGIRSLLLKGMSHNLQ